MAVWPYNTNTDRESSCDLNLIFLTVSVLTKHNNVCFVCCRYCEVRDQISMSRAGDGESLMEDEEMEVEC